MQINPKFPPTRLEDPQRRAERDIYQAVEATAIPGRALYEVKVHRGARQVDIVLWAEAVATIGAQLKGGVYVIRDGEMCLVTDHGLAPKPGLLAEVWDSVMAIPKFIERKLGHGMYIVPVLSLPNMTKDDAILDMAARRQVEVIFGQEDWVERLVDLASCHPIRHRPTEESIEREVMAIMPELSPAPTTTSPQVVIQNVENLHLHVRSEDIDTLGLSDLKVEG